MNGSEAMRFFDASALIKRYVREPHSAAVRRWLATGPAAISRLSEVEVSRSRTCRWSRSWRTTRD